MELLTAKVGTITERQDRMEKKVDSIQKDVTILADNFITCLLYTSDAADD